MPIQVTCACGKAFAAKDAEAGRSVKCSACGQMIVVPGGRTSATPPQQPRPAPAPATQPAEAGEPPPKGPSQATVNLVLAVSASVAVVAVVVLILALTMGGKSKPITPPPLPAGAAPDWSPSDGQSRRGPSPAAEPGPLPRTPAKSEVGPAQLPKLASGEILVPFRGMDVSPIYFFGAKSADEAKKREEAFRAAKVGTVGQWVDWFRERPDLLPTIAFLRKPLPRDELFSTLGGSAPRTETDLLTRTDIPANKGIPVTWHQYQGVGFAEDEGGKILAVRITTPIAPPEKPPEPK